ISVAQDGSEDERIFDYDRVENPKNQHKHGNYIFENSETNNSRSHENLNTNSDKSVRNNKDCLNLDNFDDESVYNLTQDNEHVYNLTQDNESIYDLTQDGESLYDLSQDGESSYNLSQDNKNVYEPTQDSDLIQGVSLAMDKNYENEEVDLFYENEM
ncbi:1713_t:CDS:2, partial [Dentiscutata erythropus]